MRLIHVHIPRTGGTTFKRIMDQIYGSENIDCLWAPESQAIQSPLGLYIRDQHCDFYQDWGKFKEEWRAFRAEQREIEEQCQVYHGHTPLLLYPGYLLRNSFLATWIRHPVSLQISWYLWDRAHGHLVDFEGIHDFIEQQSRINIMSRMIGPVDLEFVGIYEFFREDLARVGKMLHWPVVYVPHTNRNPSPGYAEEFRALHSDHGLRQKIIHLNRDDMELYRDHLSRRIS